MTAPRDPLVYLQDMLHAVEKARCQFTQGMDPADFVNNEEKIFAVIRALEILGEAAKHVPGICPERISRVPMANNRRNP